MKWRLGFLLFVGRGAAGEDGDRKYGIIDFPAKVTLETSKEGGFYK